MKQPIGPRGAYGKAPESPATLGKRIRAVRVGWNWTLKQLGAAIHYSDRAISNWEQETQIPGAPAIGVLADLFGLPVEALETGVGFKIPQPPRQMGGLLVADNYATDMVVLPAHRRGKIALVDKESGSFEEISATRMTQLAREACGDQRQVWVVIGPPKPKAKKHRTEAKTT